jgi:hypothetical protein
MVILEDRLERGACLAETPEKRKNFLSYTLTRTNTAPSPSVGMVQL